MKINRDIKYLNKDFNSWREQLINYSQTYFPTTYTDFSPSSLGVMFIEQASYVGDVLSFYLDNQVQENFIQHARQKNNLYEMAYMFGYKPKTTNAATVELDIYQLVPAKTSGSSIVPDYDYALFIEGNSTATSTEGVNFIIEEPVDFSISSSLDPTIVTISQLSGGQPTYFLLNKKRKAVSSTITTATYSIGEYEEFPTIEINASNIIGILDIFDSDGNQWYEVDYLGEEIVFDSIKNDNVNVFENESTTEIPYILRAKQVQRRFTSRFLNESTLQIQFGSGKSSDNDIEQMPNPQNVGIGLPFQQSKLNTAYSPTNFIFTNTYGIAPSNTTLTIRYLTGGGVSSNVASNTINTIVSENNNIRFITGNLNEVTSATILNSLSVNNEAAASGGKDGDTTEEIRQNSMANFGSQLRNVTPNDYLIRSLSMPGRYGVVAKSFVTKPSVNISNSTLDLYVLSQDVNGNLTLPSTLLKQNLQTYLNEYKMVGDSINIKDGYIVNIGIDFEIMVLPNFNSNEVIVRCIQELQDFFDIDKWQLNQPIILRELFVLLDKVDGVQTVKKVEVTNKVGENLGYSKYAYDIKGATQNGIIYPSLDPCIFEVKFPNDDIKGKAINF